MRLQGVNNDGELLSSAYVEKSHDYGFEPVGPSLARQEFAEECDINNIMARYEKTGVITPNPLPPTYMDFTGAPNNLFDAMRFFQEAAHAFVQNVPAQARLRFNNDPAKFVEFASDPANLDQLREWNLAPPKPVPQPAPGEPAPPSGQPG